MKKRMRSSSAISRHSRAMATPLRNSPRRFSRPFVPFSIGNIGSAPLSRFRQVTHSPKIGRVSSQGGPHFGVFNLKFNMEKICKDRKERREVMFAKGVSGGPHRPPTYTFKSLVRC